MTAPYHGVARAEMQRTLAVGYAAARECALATEGQSVKRGFAMMLAATILLGGTGVAGAKPPQWDKIFSGNSRFKVLSGFGGLAVLDRETGLVWERDSTQ